MAENHTADVKKRTAIQSVFEWIETFCLALMGVVILFTFFCRFVTVQGPSMMNTLQDGDRLIISNLLYSPKAGDIVVIQDSKEKDFRGPIIKRVIATEGETVRISYSSQSMTVTVTDKDGNTETLVEDYILYTVPRYLPDTYTVPEGKIFVLGDNRSMSKDSRDPDIGFVDEREILGKVLFRISPLSKIGTVK